MARVTLRLYTTLKDIAQTGRLELEADNVASALQRAVSKAGGKFSQTLFDDEKSRENNVVVRNCFTLVVNSEMIGLKDLEKKVLSEGDMIHIFPPIAGGSEILNRCGCAVIDKK